MDWAFAVIYKEEKDVGRGQDILQRYSNLQWSSQMMPPIWFERNKVHWNSQCIGLWILKYFVDCPLYHHNLHSSPKVFKHYQRSLYHVYFWIIKLLNKRIWHWKQINLNQDPGRNQNQFLDLELNHWQIREKCLLRLRVFKRIARRA